MYIPIYRFRLANLPSTHSTSSRRAAYNCDVNVRPLWASNGGHTDEGGAGVHRNVSRHFCWLHRWIDDSAAALLCTWARILPKGCSSSSSSDCVCVCVCALRPASAAPRPREFNTSAKVGTRSTRRGDGLARSRCVTSLSPMERRHLHLDNIQSETDRFIKAQPSTPPLFHNPSDDSCLARDDYA